MQANQELRRHTQKFCWISMWGVTDKPLTSKYFRDEIDTLVDNIENPLLEIEKLKKEHSRRKEIFDKTLKKLNASEHLEGLARILQSYVFLRTYRKNAYSKANYLHLPLLYETGRRMGLNNREAKYVTYDEMLDFLDKGKGVFKPLIKERIKGWATLLWDGETFVFSGKSEVKRAIKKYNIFVEEASEGNQVKGRVASTGKVRGKVRVVRSLKGIGKVEKGDILVATMTTPDYMLAIHKCAGIVTDEGGVTCHAAIISREFNIPCIVGTGNATQVLEDGDLVEVDAEKGIVRKLH
ncbi:hypothetical protein A2715_05160 [Candidatus Woesebacteria bacterium RIFCSPHIGHO2_01_FULL_39_32]|uniref:PEP-utilising enzyme mobile domain-containing protein n=1 Tax=Candidatus Woesebacteria bacterium RIFCSPLOWO2_01_FULL_39_25 TaxID=1802521 RepID=A0A1F8BNS1_9BACT|nr:MAG: hypothetical protein A2124_05165 [Candidatus Woesebacteria bacterium GWB1_37_5]OGM25407.1 MAG: hypothetical protein A2715_05160 [Candidatus Woesebacteria bacterium RIFCSPHIGHO2_01_FULL_39_32]OGM64938.1 MAG: hypothetical protein A2893_04770 [Candidatus Woesebacteria bacterium RIFCSPLOWO2_01_FULL_39_25]